MLVFLNVYGNVQKLYSGTISKIVLYPNKHIKIEKSKKDHGDIFYTDNRMKMIWFVLE